MIDNKLKTEAVALLSKRSATKQQYKEMLARLVGFTLVQEDTSVKTLTLHQRCRKMFLDYCNSNNILYSFCARDGKAINELITKIQNITPEGKTDKEVFFTFKYLIHNIPEWYKKNAFSLSTFSNNFNSIVNTIKQNSSNEDKHRSYKEEQLRTLIGRN